MPKPDSATITFEDAKIIFRNFAGKEGLYNAEGTRSFSVIIPDQKLAERLIAEGWNVKFREPKEEGDEPFYHLAVAVNFESGRPPSIAMITSTGRVRLNAETVDCLDYADIANIDMIVNPSHWQVRDASGIKAYLKTMFVTINEDELERKYALMEGDSGEPG